jgi:hypothetical protein
MPLPVAVPAIVTVALKVAGAWISLPTSRKTPWLPLPVAVALPLPVSETAGGVGEMPVPRLMFALL